MKNLIVVTLTAIFFVTGCKKSDVSDSIQTTKNTTTIKKNRSNINLQNLFGDNINSSTLLISSNDNLSEVLNSEFISTRLTLANLGSIGENYTNVTNSENGCHAFVIELSGTSNIEAELLILPIVEGSNIFTVFLTKSITNSDGTIETFIAQLNNEEEIDFEPAAAKINKTKQWWKDCITSGYNTLTNDLVGQIAWATNTAIVWQL